MRYDGNNMQILKTIIRILCYVGAFIALYYLSMDLVFTFINITDPITRSLLPFGVFLVLIAFAHYLESGSVLGKFQTSVVILYIVLVTFTFIQKQRCTPLDFVNRPDSDVSFGNNKTVEEYKSCMTFGIYKPKNTSAILEL